MPRACGALFFGGWSHRCDEEQSFVTARLIRTQVLCAAAEAGSGRKKSLDAGLKASASRKRRGERLFQSPVHPCLGDAPGLCRPRGARCQESRFPTAEAVGFPMSSRGAGRGWLLVAVSRGHGSNLAGR